MTDNEFIHFDIYGRIVIATVQGAERLDTTNAPAFGEALMAYVEEHLSSHILLNLSKVEYLSSAIISEIIRAHKALQKHDGSMRVCGANEYIASVFRVTGLEKIFSPIHQVREAAEEYNTALNRGK